MTERVSVNIHILQELKKEAHFLYEDCGTFEYDIQKDGETYCRYEFHECKDGETDHEAKLLRLGIPYDKEWEGCCDFEAGIEKMRFDSQGLPQIKEFARSKESIPLNLLAEFINQPEKLKGIIQAGLEIIQTLPLDSKQLHNRKLYLARQLLTSK